MHPTDLIVIYVGLSVMCLFGIYGGYKGRIRFGKSPLYYSFLLFLCIILNFIVLGNLLYHSRYVPGEQKGGLYGLLAGASFGGILFSIMISGSLFGISIRAIRSGGKGVLKSDSEENKYAYPVWFTRFSVGLLSALAAMTIGNILIMLIEKKTIDDMAAWFAIPTGISILFLIGSACLIVQKYVLKK